MIKIFIRNFEAEYGTKITKIYARNRISTTHPDILIGLPRLAIQSKKNKATEYSRVFMKLPSLYSYKNAARKENMFAREVHFYETLLPELYRLGNCQPFSAKLYASTETKAFIIEDFTPLGYYPGDTETQLSLDEIWVALDLLATFHALGYKYLRSLSQDDSKMSLICSYQPALIMPSREEVFQKFLQLVIPSSSGTSYHKVIELKDEILPDPITRKYEAENGMTVIIHADYRTDNILFRKEGEKVIQGKIIDWQRGREANPVLDLIFFFVTSVPIDIFQDKDDALIHYYLDKLNSILSSTQCSRLYKRSELDKDILYYNHFYLRMLLITWPIILESGQSEAVMSAYVSSAVKWLNFLERRGII